MSAYSDLVIADGAQAYWKLGEPSGTNANDEIGTADGTYTDTPTFGGAGIIGDPGTSTSFAAASSEYVAVGTMPAIVDTFTLELWVKRASTSAGTHVYLSCATGAQIYSYNNNLTFDLAFTGICLDTAVSFWTDTASFHHVVVCKNGADRRMYFDGVEPSYSSNVARTFTSKTAITLAAQAAGANPMNGAMCHVAIYPTALSAGTVAAHYTAGITPPTPPPFIGGNAIGYP